MKQPFGILEESTAKLNVQRSQFYSHIFEIDTVMQAKEKIKRLSKSYSDATHLCWALRVLEKELVELCSDGGEPKGTAGFPILNVLKEHDLINVCCVVIRYFGGVKLGVRGLIDAYSEAARLAVRSVKIVPLTKLFEHTFFCKYDQLGEVLRIIRQADGKIERIEQGEIVTVQALLNEKIERFDPQIVEKLVKML
ncbi:IMPACT family protein [Pseudothermotoga sp. U03pept]|uniref:IMPACT family protein n=1 Tax=Pseudothermotoga sp. U03pept TaxID=3447012 RepID=UPI003F04851B